MHACVRIAMPAPSSPCRSLEGGETPTRTHTHLSRSYACCTCRSPLVTMRISPTHTRTHLLCHVATPAAAWFPSITAYSHAASGVRVTFAFSKPPGQPAITEVNAAYACTGSAAVTEFNLQVRSSGCRCRWWRWPTQDGKPGISVRNAGRSHGAQGPRQVKMAPCQLVIPTQAVVRMRQLLVSGRGEQGAGREVMEVQLVFVRHAACGLPLAWGAGAPGQASWRWPLLRGSERRQRHVVVVVVVVSWRMGARLAGLAAAASTRVACLRCATTREHQTSLPTGCGAQGHAHKYMPTPQPSTPLRSLTTGCGAQVHAAAPGTGVFLHTCRGRPAGDAKTVREQHTARRQGEGGCVPLP